MRCFVNGLEVARTVLARRAMNFTQRFPEPATPVVYQLSLGTDEFLAQVGGLYQQFARDEQADAPYQTRGEFPELDRWQDLAYPPLEDLLVREPELVEGLVKEDFSQELLDRLIPGPESGLPRVLVNTIDRVTIADGAVVIEGQAYLHPMLGQDQSPQSGTVLSTRPA
jgi:hypothetical protein